MLIQTLGERLKQLRQERGWTQEKLADKAQVTARVLRYWESSSQCPREMELESVLKALKATSKEKQQVYALLPETRTIRQMPNVIMSDSIPPSLPGQIPGIGDLLRAMRHRRGWTQEQLAAEMKVSRTAILRWETTRNLPSEDLLERLCLLLNASLEEKDVLSARRLLPGHWALQLTLEECRHQYALLRQIQDGNNGLMPLTDLYSLSLKRQLYSLLPHSPEALPLLTKVEVHHCWWLYMQERTAEACAGCWRLLQLADSTLASDNSFVGALNLLSAKVVSSANGEQNAIRLLSRWLKILPERLHYWLLCDMALYAGRAQQASAAHHFLNRAQQVRCHVIATEPGREWHIDWYYQMATGRVFLSTGKADVALERLPPLELTGDENLISLLVWAEAALAAEEKHLASRYLGEAQSSLTKLPLPQRQAKFDQLARQL